MKISELIYHLEYLQRRYGDIPIYKETHIDSEELQFKDIDFNGFHKDGHPYKQGLYVDYD